MLEVTGGSDDLIEIDGDIREEFNVSYKHEDDGYLAFSDGTLLKVKYDENGIWRFKVISKGPLYDQKVEGIADEDTFDVVLFKEGIKWVLYGFQRA